MSYVVDCLERENRQKILIGDPDAKEMNSINLSQRQGREHDISRSRSRIYERVEKNGKEDSMSSK
jgi:hypothetical protein